MRKQMGRLMAGATVAVVVAGVANYSQQRTEAAFSTPVNVAVTANVASNCVMTAGSVAFGAYDPLVTHAAANLDQTGSVSVACVKGTVANVGLGAGSNFSGSRRMSNGTDFLGYELYTTAGRTTVWDTTNRVGYTAASKASTSLTIYGRVPSNQDVSAGSYTDTVVAQAEF
jgi:spore coat protein U-like protein